jgi:hypothetical protein
MKSFMKKLTKAFWLYIQPLTQRPEQVGDPVSDLFIWRRSKEWKTFFELTDIAGLFDDRDGASSRSVTIVFFDNKGDQFLEKCLELLPNQRQTIDLSEFVSESQSSFGTFCIFHSTPQVISGLGSFITERGYVSYRYKNAPLRSYVHGNLDAVSLSRNKSLKLLCLSSFFLREYRLQHELLGPALYEVGIVNPSSRKKKFICHVLSSKEGGMLSTQEIILRPRASHVFPIQVEKLQSVRVVIKSYLVMARPLVYRTQKQHIDVFHG